MGVPRRECTLWLLSFVSQVYISLSLFGSTLELLTNLFTSCGLVKKYEGVGGGGGGGVGRSRDGVGHPVFLKEIVAHLTQSTKMVTPFSLKDENFSSRN